MQHVIQVLSVAVAGFLIGGFSIPYGLALGLDPLTIYVAAAAGGIGCAYVLLAMGSWLRTRLIKHPLKPGTIKKSHDFIDRHGYKAFCFISPVITGIIPGALLVVALDLDRKTYRRWLTAGIIVLYGIYSIIAAITRR